MNEILLPLVAYLALTLATAWWAQRGASRGGSSSAFLEEYFLGSRTMGAFVLAMTIIASYTSASSFVGGPGVAYRLGLGWVLLAMIQVPTTFLTLGVLGRRFATLGRRLKAVTIPDFLYARYGSDVVVVLCSLAILVFFFASMLAQFIGGGRLFQALTGQPYEYGLGVFGLCVVAYTAIGGFRAVVLTDALQGVVMLVASVVVLLAVVSAGGGVGSCVQGLKAIDPGLIAPTGANGAIAPPMLFSFWILVGLGILGLPQTTQRCLGYKDASSMQGAMVIGTAVIGLILLCMHLAGALGRAVVPDLPSGDLIIPTLITRLLSPLWAGIFVAGPLAAIMSTVDTMLLMVSATLVKDLYLRYRLKGDASRCPERRAVRMSRLCTVAMGAMVFLAALDPPDLLVWINLFAFGGLEAVFLWPLLLGLYWRRANACGAVASIVVGLAAFVFLTVAEISPLGTHPIVATLLLSGFAFVVASRFGTGPDGSVLDAFCDGRG